MSRRNGGGLPGLALGLIACSGDGGAAGNAALVSASYANDFEEVRDCRRSGDHNLNYVRVLVNAEGLEAYLRRDRSFPQGAVVIKEEYADQTCTDLAGFTAMRREAPGYAENAGDWRWQRLDGEGRILDDGKIPTCQGCHAPCAAGDQGHDWTCAEP